MKQASFPSGILAVFVFSLCYWIYLAATTQMNISFDSIGYERLGRLLQNQGFIEYLRTGPNREPLYPLLVMLSMHLEAMSHIAYTKIMAFLCVLILLASQILIYTILKELRIRISLCVITLAYFAISPAINNAAFSLYSEIATFPLILLVLLANIKAYQSIQTGSSTNALCAGMYVGFAFCLITFVKGIFEFIFPIFSLLYLILMLACFIQGQRKMAINCLLILFAFTACYQIPVISYKLLNKKYNDHYALTNRGSWALYASSARRAEKLTPERLLTALAYIPGKGFCEDTLGRDKCYFWGIETLDAFGISKAQEVAKTTPADLVDQKMMALSKEKILSNPGQFFLLMGFDGLKMFFWESTQIGFVSYPPWLQRLYNNHLLKNGWRAIISLLCLSGFAFLIIFFCKNVTQFLHFNTVNDQRIIDSVLIFILLSSFIACYALFDTIPRFALPIASLELITIALLAEALINQFHPCSKRGE
jgi:hypothetical protein